MKHNILLIHLESLNVMNYYINYECFKTLHQVQQKSVNFSRFYSSATSTLMVMADIAFQGRYLNEGFRAMGWLRRDKIADDSLFDELRGKGFDVAIQDYPRNGVDAQSMNSNYFLGKSVCLKEFDDLNAYHKNMIEVMDGSKPFILWLCNFMSHIDFNHYADSEECGINRWNKGYMRLDEEIQYVMSLLKDKNLLSSSSIIFYGDHGDDMFSHGYHGGLTHAIEPFEQLIHTPMFIYDERIGKGEISDVMSSNDIGKIINRLLELPNKQCTVDDLIFGNYKYAFSRNMFAAQRVREESFGKGYSVTDGRYLLMVNSKGLSMFETRMDPLCQNNLLDFFYLDSGKLYSNRKMIDSLHFHFSYLFDNISFYMIEMKYNELYPVLKENVEHIYTLGECFDRLYEMDFNSINYSVELEQLMKNVGDQCFCKQVIFSKYYDGKRVVLYGAGKYGVKCYEYLKDRCCIIAWVDSNYELINNEKGYDIIAPETIKDKEFDIVYIAVDNSRIMQEIYEVLIGWGIDKKRII